MKKIIAIMLIMAMLIGGCSKAENNTTEPTNVTSAPTEGSGGTASMSEATKGTEPTFEPTEALTEPTEATKSPIETTEPTEPSSEEFTDTDPEPDPYADIKYYPFPLLDMTVAEIEATYGELEYMYYMYGGTPIYKLNSLEIELEFDDIEALGIEIGEPLPLDAKPACISICSNQKIHPGLSVGMEANDVSKDFEWRNYGLYNLGEGRVSYCAFLDVDGYLINVLFAIPNHIKEEYPPSYGFTDEQLDALKPWADEFIYNLYDTEISGIEIYK